MGDKIRIVLGVVVVVAFGLWLGHALVDIVSSSPPKPNVILLLLDTARADHVGSCSAEDNGYYSADGLTPHLDSLAATGIAYPYCQAQASWTLPCMVSIFTGVSQRAHGANTGPDYMTGISEEYTTIAEMMHNARYDTYGLFNVPVMDEPYGFHQGYDFVNAEGCTLAVDAKTVVDQGTQWLDDRGNADGFFMSLHFFDAHYPYDPPQTYWDRLGLERFNFPSAQGIIASFYNGEVTEQDFDILHALYCAEIHSMDAEIGRLFAALRARGLADSTIIIVVADHGEEFGEHGEIFHRSFFQEVIHVPLIIAGPGVPGGLVVNNAVGQYDILPTLAHLLGLECPDYVEGYVALPDCTSHGAIPSSGEITGVKPIIAIRSNNAKTFWEAEEDQAIGFDLSENPGETEPLSVPESLVGAARTLWATPHAFTPMIVPNSEQRSELMRDLGYIR
jgi:arylsulfatase A-like enzyme